MARLLAKRTVVGLVAMVALSVPMVGAAEEGESVPLQWTQGPGTASIGSDLAEIDLGQDYVFLDAEGTRRFMELNENPVSGNELATVAPLSDDQQWFLVFEFDEVGYVSDEEKDSLDADAITGVGCSSRTAPASGIFWSSPQPMFAAGVASSEIT